MNETQNKKKAGFVALIGRPSSGKSTLINTICGDKICIVSEKPQTTQFIVRGIYNDEKSQIIFIDTPGYHNFDSNLNRGLSNLALRNISEGDIILYIVDTTRSIGAEENEIIEQLRKVKNKKIVIVYNKIDSEDSKPDEIKNEITGKVNALYEVEVSAKDNKNIDKLINVITDALPFSEPYYPVDYVTDQSIPFRIKEVVREKIINNTAEELPYSVYIAVDYLDVKDDCITAYADIFVERESQKGMIVGKKGMMIKKIGAESRIELENIFEKKVNLFCKVKVHPNWKKDKIFLKKLFSLE